MLVLKKIKGTKRIFLTTIIIIAALVAVYLVYSQYFSKQAKLRYGIIGSSQINQVEIFTPPTVDLNINLDLTKKAPYIDLRQYGILPVVPGEKGRVNPFKSISFSFTESN